MFLAFLFFYSLEVCTYTLESKFVFFIPDSPVQGNEYSLTKRAYFYLVTSLLLFFSIGDIIQCLRILSQDYADRVGHNECKNGHKVKHKFN